MDSGCRRSGFFEASLLHTKEKEAANQRNDLLLLSAAPLQPLMAGLRRRLQVNCRQRSRYP